MAPRFPPPAPAQSVQVPAELVAASVHVSTGGGMGSGTCFYVDEGRGYAFILTCRHVVPHQMSPKQLITRFPGGQRIETYWQGVDDGGTDLAILVIQGDSKTPWVPIAASAPEKGEDIYQVGYPRGQGPSRKLGRYLGALPGRRSHGVSLPIQPGDSGSGVFRKTTKELCGVVWGWEGSPSDSRIVAWADVDRFCELTCRRIIGKSRPWLRPLGPITQRPPQMPTVPGPVPVPVPPAHDQSKDLAALSASVADLKKMIEGLKLVAGKDGLDGLNGKDGKDGSSGKPGRDGLDGKDGKPGPQGPAGPAGKDADTAALQAQIDALKDQLGRLQTTVGNLPGAIRVRVEPTK